VDLDWLWGEEFPATKVKSPGHVVELDGRLGWTSPNTTHNVNFEPKKKKKFTPPVIVSKIPALGNSSAKQTISAKQGGRRRKKTRRGGEITRLTAVDMMRGTATHTLGQKINEIIDVINGTPAGTGGTGGARRRRRRRKTRRKRRYGPGGETFFSKLIPNLLPPQHLGTVGMWI